MNFKTTIVLAVLLLVVGGFIFFRGDHSTTSTETPAAKKLLDISAADVQSFSISPSDGKKMTFVRDGVNKWNITEPVTAPADAGIVQAALADLTALEPQTKEVDVSDGTGLKSPRLRVDLATKDGKTASVAIGDRSSVGDRLYVQLGGNAKADMVATGVDDELGKPLNDFREKKLVDLTTDQVKYIVINRPDGKIELSKSGDKWQMISPKEIPADSAAVTDLLIAATSLQAAEFVDGSTTQPMYGLGAGAKSITLAAAAPSATQPTTQPAPLTLVVGRADTILEKNLYVSVDGAHTIVKVPKESLTFMDHTVLDLRGKEVTDVMPSSVNKLTVTVDRPATTQPTKKAAEKTVASVVRRPSSTTRPATTRASTMPAAEPPRTKWVADDAKRGDADDSTIDRILAALHPLRAEKYVETAPTAGTTITVKVESGGTGVLLRSTLELQIVDPGNAKPPIATYHDLHFEVDRSLVEKLESKFAEPAPPAPATPPATPGMGPEPQMP